VVEVFTPCPTAYGRRNKMGSAVQMVQDYKANSISAKKAAMLSDDELKGKIITGVLVDLDKTEYIERTE